MPELRSRRLVPALLCALVVLLGVAWVAGRQSLVGASDGPPRSLDAVRLGPEPGQRVADYLAGLPARSPSAGTPSVPALVQFAAPLDAASAVPLLAGVAPETAVLRVPLPRVQTALRFEPLPPVDASAGLPRRFELAWGAAARDASASVGRLSGRASQVAGYEAATLSGALRSGPAQCRCLLAVLVVGDRAALAAVGARPGVRAVDAAPVGTPVSGVALAPLLPEQTEVAGPVPDDGPVPPVVGG